MANRRYTYFAAQADVQVLMRVPSLACTDAAVGIMRNSSCVQGYSDIASVFRSIAEGETGHAHGHLEFLQEVTRLFIVAARPCRLVVTLACSRSIV
jgi:rubrerythrin